MCQAIPAIILPLPTPAPSPMRKPALSPLLRILQCCCDAYTIASSCISERQAVARDSLGRVRSNQMLGGSTLEREEVSTMGSGCGYPRCSRYGRYIE